MSEKKFGTIVTNEGAALIAECILTGKTLPITEAAAGDGGGAYYEPTTDQTALKGECWRGEIAGFALSEYSPNMIDVKIIIDDAVGGFTVREMGLFTDDGILFAVCNTPDTEKVSITGGIPGRLTMTMHIIVADASAVEVVINPDLDVVTPEQLAQIISEHNADEHSHPDIRALALNSMQQGDAYTKEESEENLNSAFAAHNSDTGAHPSLQISLSSLESRIEMIELKYSTNVTGNPFAVSFGSLSGLTVTNGCYDAANARITF